MRKSEAIKGFFLVFIMFVSILATAQVETRSGKQRGERPDDPSERMKGQIEKLNQKLIQATINNDVEALMGLYAVDVISMPNYGEMIQGKAALKASQEKMIESGNKVTAMNLKTLEVMKSGSDFIEIGTYKITIHSAQMQMPITDEGKYLNIWVKVGKGDMKIKLEIWNTDINPMTFMEKMSQEKKTLEGTTPEKPAEEKP